MAYAMVVVVAGVIARGGRYLLARRGAEAADALKWEFPGGKIEDGETPQRALERELAEELEIEVRAGRILDAFVHPRSPYGSLGLMILYCEAEIIRGEPRAIDCEQIDWVAPGDMERLEMSAVDALFARTLPMSDS